MRHHTGSNSLYAFDAEMAKAYITQEYGFDFDNALKIRKYDPTVTEYLTRGDLDNGMAVIVATIECRCGISQCFYVEMTDVDGERITAAEIVVCEPCYNDNPNQQVYIYNK